MRNALTSFQLIAFFASFQVASAQVIDEDAKKETPPGLEVVIQGPTEGIPVPIGVKEVLTAVHEPVESPTYHWVATCLKFVAGEWREETKPLLRHRDDWDKAEIDDCWGYESRVKYLVKVNHKTAGKGPGSKEIIVRYESPNFCEVKTGNLAILENAFVTPRITTLFLKQKNGKKEPIGPCALACCTEDWTWIPDKDNDFMTEHYPKVVLKDFPKCQSPSSEYRVDGSKGSLGNFAQNTWIWKSPTLTDVQWVMRFPWLNGEQFRRGDVLGNYNMVYTFKGKKCPDCDDCQWKKRTPQFSCALEVDIVDGVKVVKIVSTYTGGDLNAPNN
jgi:hypothetical protein